MPVNTFELFKVYISPNILRIIHWKGLNQFLLVAGESEKVG